VFFVLRVLRHLRAFVIQTSSHQLAHRRCLGQQGRGCIVIDVAQAKDPPPGESHLFGETLGAYVPYQIVRVTGDADRQEAG
jgi:hypothetical protein